MTQLPQATVADVSPRTLRVEHSRGVRDILAKLDFNDHGVFKCLFVSVENGEYTEVWATRASIPWSHTTAYKVR